MKRRLSKVGKKRAKTTKSYRLRAEPGHFQVTGQDAELVVRAKQVVEAMAGAPLPADQRQDIRRNLSILTDGRVGGYKFRLKDPKAARKSALKSLKSAAGDLTKKAAEKMAEQAGVAAWAALVEALRRFVDFVSR